MKRTLYLTLLPLLLLLGGCGGESTSPPPAVPESTAPAVTSAAAESTTEKETAKETEPAETEAPPEKTVVTYGDFGAVGDGKHDDLSAITAAHAYANRHGLPVRAEEGKVYYIASTISAANADCRGVS